MLIWQRLVKQWHKLVFNDVFIPPAVRILRVFEELVETAQCEDVPLDTLITVAKQVYSREKGSAAFRELGAVLITLADYANSRQYDLEECFLQEYERILDQKIIDRVRFRNLHSDGDKIGLRE